MKPTLLLVDDEERILRSLSMLLRPHYHVTATTNAHAALDHLRDNRVHVVISDQRMPVMRGAELLRQAKEISPNTMRVLLTGYSELDAAIASVNEGEVFRFVNKPWDGAELKRTVGQAVGISQALFDAAAGGEPVAVPEPAVGDAILAVDEDPATLKQIQEAAPQGTRVYVATSVDAAFALLERNRIGVVISELSVAQEPVGVALKMLKAQHPEVVTIVMTPFQDAQVLIGLINEGQIYRYLPKPARRLALNIAIASALRQHRSLRASPALRQARKVEPMPSAEQSASGIAGRVLGYLARLRVAT